MTTTGTNLEENQKAHSTGQRQASKASSLAGDRLLCRWPEICPRLYRSRKGVELCAPAKEIPGGEVNARRAGKLISFGMRQAADDLAAAPCGIRDSVL